MKILVTGGSGMVGRNLIESNIQKHHDIVYPSSSELNLINQRSTNEYIKSTKPDLVIHCAGKVGGIQANIENPVDFLFINNQIGFNLIDAALSNNVHNFINLSSSCIYPRNAKNPLNESDILTGILEPTNEGYAIAKIAVMKLCEYIYNKKNLNYLNIIPCNLYGPHDNFNEIHSHMIPAVIKKIHDAKIKNTSKVEIWGDGKSKREFMYISDLIDLIIIVVRKLEKGLKIPQTMNAGHNKDYSILEYYEKIAEVIGFEGQFSFDVSKPSGMPQKLVNSSISNDFGWKSETPLVTGLKKTYKYYIENYAKN